MQEIVNWRKEITCPQTGKEQNDRHRQDKILDREDEREIEMEYK